ncbi:MAG: bifunctional phosphopantothenoylcysteine decarboxylase/phosphopantothenate--cysteine ligase CoaBC, partial [archaeon YNP-WB-062]|nr:bifunctional phosphopantothenoylcysteine decarboxylase/phosphopantothenate--cysteine ligase CoaBC [Candidatus Culexarchaeum yellowstonense]
LRGREYQYIFLSAAPLDYKFAEKFSGKIPSERGELNVKLVVTPKISSQVRRYAENSVIVGFKAEYGVPLEEMIERAYKRLLENNLDLIVANDVSRRDIGFESEYNEVYIIDAKKNVTHIPKMKKRMIAREIIKRALEIEKSKNIKA